MATDYHSPDESLGHSHCHHTIIHGCPTTTPATPPNVPATNPAVVADIWKLDEESTVVLGCVLAADLLAAVDDRGSAGRSV